MLVDPGQARIFLSSFRKMLRCREADGSRRLDEFAENEEEREFLRGVLRRECGTPPPPPLRGARRRERDNEEASEVMRRSVRIAKARKKGEGGGER